MCSPGTRYSTAASANLALTRRPSASAMKPTAGPGPRKLPKARRSHGAEMKCLTAGDGNSQWDFSLNWNNRIETRQPSAAEGCREARATRESDDGPLAGQEVERRVAVHRHAAQPAGKLVDHQPGRDARRIDRAAGGAATRLGLRLGEERRGIMVAADGRRPRPTREELRPASCHRPRSGTVQPADRQMAARASMESTQQNTA